MVLPQTTGPNLLWSMDFVADTLWNGRRIRTLTVIDTWNRKVVWIEVDHSLSGKRVRPPMGSRSLSGADPG